MTPVELPDFFTYRGDTDNWGFVVRDAANNVVDITGRTYRTTVSRVKHPQATEAAAAQVAQLAGVILDAPNGLVGFQPLATTFDALPAREFKQGVASLWYDIEQVNGAAVLTFGTGRFFLYQDISK